MPLAMTVVVVVGGFFGYHGPSLVGLLSVTLGLFPSIVGEFDPGSGRTLAACLTHASRTMMPSLLGGLVANG